MTLVLRGITWEHERGSGSASAASEAIRAEGLDVRIEWSARSLAAFGDQPLEELAPHADLLIIDHPQVPRAAEAGVLLPLDEPNRIETLAGLAHRSVGTSFASYRHIDRQWALPVDAAAQVSVHRPDLLPHPPVTWDEVDDLARHGSVLVPAARIDAYSMLLTLAAADGPGAFAREGIFLEVDELDTALARLARLVGYTGPAAFEINPIRAAELLSTSDDWCYSPLLFGYSNYSRTGFRPHRLVYRDVPRGRSGLRGTLLGGAGIAVSAETRHPDEAAAVAYRFASSEIQRGAWFDGGGQPAHADAWDDDMLNAMTCDFFRGTRATLESAWLRPAAAHYAVLQDRVANTVAAFLRGTIPRDLAVRDIREHSARLGEGIHADR